MNVPEVESGPGWAFAIAPDGTVVMAYADTEEDAVTCLLFSEKLQCSYSQQ